MPLRNRLFSFIGRVVPRNTKPGPVKFISTADYWDSRYRSGGNSGAGSYGRLARFKADIVNRFVRENNINSVVEFGCGDGAQLELAEYPQYVGIDISPRTIDICKQKFKDQPNKQFLVASDRKVDAISADLALSLDVVYHLVEDDLYQQYMRRLVDAGKRFIGLYTSNVEKDEIVPHIRHHCITEWFAAHAPEWALISKYDNPFPLDWSNLNETSWADFYFYARKT